MESSKFTDFKNDGFSTAMTKAQIIHLSGKQITEIFKNLLGKNFIYNRVKLQSGAYKVEDCAAFVLARVFLSKLKQREFVGLFQRRLTLQSADDIVSALVLLHFVNV